MSLCRERCRRSCKLLVDITDRVASSRPRRYGVNSLIGTPVGGAIAPVSPVSRPHSAIAQIALRPNS